MTQLDPEMSFIQVAALSSAAVACAIDLRWRRIPNWLTIGAALMGITYHAVVGGWGGLQTASAGWAIGLAIFFVPFALGGLGAGDVKLVAALGAWLGPANVMWLGLYTGVVGGALALIVACSRGYLRQALQNIWLLLMFWRVSGVRPLPELTIHDGRGPKLAYGLSIFLGTVVTIWLQ
jgi:prepilin peptidase CpaA